MWINVSTQLLAHNTHMNSVQSEIYLGDCISSDLTNTLNIRSRCNRAIGTTSQIMTILNQVSQGFHFFTIGLILREAILISKLLLNSEVWVKLTTPQINLLEQADLTLQRRILKCHPKTNIEIIYGELSTTPIHISLRKRRMMYLGHILTRSGQNIPQIHQK